MGACFFYLEKALLLVLQVNTFKVLLRKKIKKSLYSRGSYTQYLVITYNGRELEKEWICKAESFCCMREPNTML